jgi:hypothetical protein
VGRYENGQWTVFDARTGLLEEECNVNSLRLDADGSVLVGTMGSLARLSPALLPKQDSPLRVYWREPASTSETPSLTLPAERRHLRAVWHAPWLRGEPVEYRTRIPRLGNTWNAPQTNRELVLGNLGPGAWEVEVSARLHRAGSTASEWSPPAVLRVDVQPHFYETAWARGLGVLLLGAAAVGAVRVRTWRLRRSNEKLQEAVDAAVAKIKVLSGLLPICASCKKVRGDGGYWSQIEVYIQEHAEVDFSHGICPECVERLYPEFAAEQKAESSKGSPNAS